MPGDSPNTNKSLFQRARDKAVRFFSRNAVDRAIVLQPMSRTDMAALNIPQTAAVAPQVHQYDEIPRDVFQDRNFDRSNARSRGPNSQNEHQYDLLPSGDSPSGEYDLLPSGDQIAQAELASKSVAPHRTDRSPYGVPIFVQDGSTVRQPTSPPSPSEQELAAAKRRYGKLPKFDESARQETIDDSPVTKRELDAAKSQYGQINGRKPLAAVSQATEKDFAPKKSPYGQIDGRKLVSDTGNAASANVGDGPKTNQLPKAQFVVKPPYQPDVPNKTLASQFLPPAKLKAPPAVMRGESSSQTKPSDISTNKPGSDAVKNGGAPSLFSENEQSGIQQRVKQWEDRALIKPIQIESKHPARKYS